MRSLMVDLLWGIGAFVVVTVLIAILHGVGVEVPPLPRWLAGA
jgi:hypothetical protein